MQRRGRGSGKGQVWGSVAIGLALIGAGCSDDACKVVAHQLRQCCAEGPAELRESCEKDAAGLEGDGNSDACEAVLDHNAYQGCAP
jgi:hypothetical protein